MKYQCKTIEEEADKIDGRSYVGLSKEKESYRITTPHGFELPEIIENLNRNDKILIKKYIRCIYKALNTGNKKKKTLTAEGDNLYDPLSALYLTVDYIQNGIYKEIETHDTTDTNGRINFSKTIKRKIPLCVNDEAYYTNFNITKKKVNSEKLLSLAQGNVINHFMQHGGELIFGNLVYVNVQNIDLDKSLITKLYKEKQTSFNTRKKQIIQWIIDYINGTILNEAKKNWDFSIVASSLWEEMIDSCYSNQKYRDKTQYGLKYRLNLKTGNKCDSTSSEHDSIYETENEIIIIDAKMYRKATNLNSSEVLDKQFGYYSSAKNKCPNKHIYNVLIKPYVEAEIDENIGVIGTIPNPLRSVIPELKDDFIIIYSVRFEEILDAYYYNKKIGYNLLNEIRDVTPESFA